MHGDTIPILCPTFSPPLIHGAAAITGWVAEGRPVQEILARFSGPFSSEDAMLSAAFDTAVLAFLSNQPELGLVLQADVLVAAQQFRVRGGGARLRLLAIAAGGGLQTNMPIEFITAHLDVSLDILFVLPGVELPERVPDHDVAICVVSDSLPDTLRRLQPILARWPRPVLNDSNRVVGGRIAGLTREGMAQLFADAAGLCAPATISCDRAEVDRALAAEDPADTLLPGLAFPLLCRPEGSHAGHLLERLENAAELAVYRDSVSAARLTVTQFVDARDAQGMFRKSRVALVQGRPFLCHMAVSDCWMIHYLNAGMTENPARRDAEALEFETFDTGFAHRHRTAFASLNARLGLDYVILDCTETPDGRLLLFEVEMAAIVHLLDPVNIFAYKQAPMRRMFAAFEDMLHQVAGRVCV